MHTLPLCPDPGIGFGPPRMCMQHAHVPVAGGLDVIMRSVFQLSHALMECEYKVGVGMPSPTLNLHLCAWVRSVLARNVVEGRVRCKHPRLRPTLLLRAAETLSVAWGQRVGTTGVRKHAWAELKGIGGA